MTETALPPPCLKVIGALDFTFRVPDRQQRDAIILDALRTLERQDLEVSGPTRLGRWEEGWSENLTNYCASNGDLEALIPGYYRRGATPMRLFGDFILPEDPWFEVNVLKVLQTWIACTYLADVDTVCEIGCGPAHNLIAFASLFPENRYVGLDWTTASQRVITEIAAREQFRIEGRRFDMFNPADFEGLPSDAAILTIGAMEQLVSDYQPFLDYLLAQNGRFYLHIEPIIELHDNDTLLGFLGNRYMRKRGYLNGYLNRLREMSASGEIRIDQERFMIGSVNYNGWNLIVWRKAD